jgi:RNA polymerase sigma-70 factor (ECF subfamily)
VDDNELEQHLSRISTLWTAVRQAHGPAADARSAAQQQLVQRYARAIFRYLLGAVRDPEVAHELFQEFALHLVRGDFRHADPARGRFRNYVKSALFHLVIEYWRGQQKQPRPLPADAEPAADPSPPESEQAFLRGWRDELLQRTWEALACLEQQTGQVFHSTLRCRVENPELSSEQMAALLAARLGRPLTAAAVRQTLHRARERFSDLLLDEVAHSLQTADLTAVEQELIDLGLFAHCQDALRRRRCVPSPAPGGGPSRA